MGQTLTHGIYLPDEGERNCYAGLAANWQLLDGAVGTVAEHTSQIAGKAPLVHTHTKSDITDLLNSNFIPSANNSYDLGSSSYQWNNLYAKNYYYNGVAWGLDKANTWTGSNTFSSILNQNINSVYSEIPSSDHFAVKGITDNNGDNVFVISFADRSSGQRDLTLRVYNTDGISQGVGLYKNPDSSYDFKPMFNGVINLGTSTTKWKSLNGVNPGALSLPGTGGYTDIKGNITDLSGGDNTFTAPYDGWVCVKSANATVIHIINTNWAVCQSATQNTAGTLCCLCPVMSGQSFKVIVNATSLEYAYIHPCKGNV